MEIQQAAELVMDLAKKNGQEKVEVLVERDNLIEVNILERKVEKVEQSTSLGLGIRVINNGRTGIASTERLSHESIKRTFLNACENSKLQDPTKIELLEPPKNIPDSSILKIYNPELEKLSLEDLTEFGFSIEESVNYADKRVVSIPYLGVSRGSSESFLLSSRGTSNRQKSNEVSAWCSPLLQDKDSRKSGIHFLHRRELDKKEGEKIGFLAVKKASEMLNASPIPGCKIPVVLDEYVAPRLLSMFFGAFSAELAQRGMSFLKGKLGEKISISELTLIDDPHLIGANNSCYIDSEGCLTKPLPIIEEGYFSNFMYNVESARKENKFSTGHAFRSYSSGISTRSHNLVWPKGSYSLEKLCSLTQKCLLVTQLEGQAGCNSISGDISIGVQGFLYENGRRIQPVENVTVAGNFFDILFKIQSTGDRYQPEISSCFIPALLIEGLSISG